MEQNVIYLPLILAVGGLVYMFIRASWVKKQAPGSERMQEISKERERERVHPCYTFTP